MTASRMSSTPSPVLALARIASSASMPMMSSISSIDPLRLGRRQVDLVQHGHHLDALLDRRVAVRDGLRLDALRRVDDQQRAFARGERARHLVGEVDVTRRIDQVELVRFAVARPVRQCGGLRLDRDPALALEVHRVEHLRFHLAIGQAAAPLDETVGQRRLAVVDVRDDREIADVLHEWIEGHRRRARVRMSIRGGEPARCGRRRVSGMLNFNGKRTRIGS